MPAGPVRCGKRGGHRLAAPGILTSMLSIPVPCLRNVNKHLAGFLSLIAGAQHLELPTANCDDVWTGITPRGGLPEGGGHVAPRASAVWLPLFMRSSASPTNASGAQIVLLLSAAGHHEMVHLHIPARAVERAQGPSQPISCQGGRPLGPKGTTTRQRQRSSGRDPWAKPPDHTGMGSRCSVGHGPCCPASYDPETGPTN